MLEPELQALIGPAPEADTPAAPAPQAGGGYEGASRFDRELALWSPSVVSPDLEILGDKVLLDARSRDMLRNDAYVSGGANLLRNNIVGAMYLLNAKPAFEVLGLDETWAEEFQQEIETKFTLAAESPDNWFDASRVNTFTGLVRMAVGVFVAGGEVLASVEWIREAPRPFKTALQFIHLDRLSNPPNQAEVEFFRGGVERDKNGAPVAYHVRMAHPSEWGFDAKPWKWKRVPTRKPWGRLQMIHIYEQTQPGQSRGVSQMVAALKEMRITKKFRDIVLQNAVLNATYAASIESELPSDVVFQALGGGNATEQGQAIIDYAANYLGAISEYSARGKNLHIDGVKIPHLFPGTKLQLRPAGGSGALGTEFEQSLLRYIAANLDVSYEQLSRDYTKTNYSSARAAMTETWKAMQSRKRMVADRFANCGYRLWLEEQVNARNIDSLPARMRSDTAWLYEPLALDALSRGEWIGASRGQIDELKETQAAVLRIKNNLSTYEEEMARLGKDWRPTFRQRERENAEIKARGLVVEEDPSMNAVSGEPRKESEE